jgi:hypothetical protein
MSDSFRSMSSEQQHSGSGSGNGYQNSPSQPSDQKEFGKALLVGVLGGLVSAAGYLVYRRLPDEQRERINGQVRTMVAQRITELRENFNI